MAVSSNVRKILVAQPKPAILEKSPFYELVSKHKLEIDYRQLLRVNAVSVKEFRSQRIDILAHTAVIFTSRTTIDSFFRICEESRITIPETMKYVCSTEAIALYLQKYIVYRKRKISFADGSFTGLVEQIVRHKDEKILMALSEPHSEELPKALTRLHIEYTPAILARTEAVDIPAEELKQYDMLVLYTPWDVKMICERVKQDEMPLIATFGDGTLKAALAQNIEVKASAPSPVSPSMAKAVDIYYSSVKKGKTVASVSNVDDSSKEEFIRNQQSKLERKVRTKKK